MGNIVMAYAVMALMYTPLASHTYGRYSYGLYSHGLNVYAAGIPHLRLDMRCYMCLDMPHHHHCDTRSDMRSWQQSFVTIQIFAHQAHKLSVKNIPKYGLYSYNQKNGFKHT